MKTRMPASRAGHARVLARMPAHHDSARGLARRELLDLLHYCRMERIAFGPLLAEARELLRNEIQYERTS